MSDDINRLLAEAKWPEDFSMAVAWLRNDYRNALRVIYELSSADPCRIDCNGHCQEHYWFQEGICPNRRANDLLKIAEEKGYWPIGS